MTAETILKHLNDMAGVCVICEYVYDLYAVKDALLSGGGIRLIKEKDYIAAPKPNGYRSLHLITEIFVPLYAGDRPVRCEIQLRTTAMDAWAGLEHNLRYVNSIAIKNKKHGFIRMDEAMLFVRLARWYCQ